MESRGAEKIADRWLVAEVELMAEETVLSDGDMAYLGPWLLKSHGRLHLTTDRLIWIRWRSGLPVGPKALQVELRDIRKCETRRSARLLWRNALVVEVEPEPESFTFLPMRKGKEAEEWRQAVTSALRILSESKKRA